METRTKFIVSALGIFVSYFYYGIFQEKLTRGVYGKGEDEERFTSILSLVFIQNVVGLLFSKVMLATLMKQGEDTTRTYYYASCSLTYLLGMVCSNMALQWVNYPTQVIGKSGKPIPVMILGVLLARKSYPVKKYLFVFMVVIGIALFMYKDSKKSGVNSGDFGVGIGELLIILSLTMDGLTGSIQERMKSEHGTKSVHMFHSMNMWSSMYLGIAILLSGEYKDFFGFVDRHPMVLWQIAILSGTGAIGQLFIFIMVADFGPLPCSIVTTSRKFFTVLGSVFLFGNSLLPRQWVATSLVFAGLFLDSVYGKASNKRK